MGWKLIREPETVLANEKLVKEFVEMEAAPYDRPLSERRMMVYERILKAGGFRPVTWASAVCHETNMTYRVNGKHTSLLLSKMSPIPKFFVTVERYKCDTLKDVASLYSTFDSSLGNRTTTDINAAFAGTIPELADIPMRLISLAISAAANLKWSVNDLKRVPAAEKAEELIDRIGFVKWLRDIVTSVDTKSKNSLCKHLVRAAVVTGMLATYDKAPTIAKHFWIMVRDESAPDRDDATRTLARFLVRATMMGHRNPSSNQKIVSFREMYVKCIRAWNAWRANETPQVLAYHQNAELPKVSK